MSGKSSPMLEDELILMESIYPGEFQTTTVQDTARTGNHSFSTVFTMELHPSTAGDSSLQNVFVALRLEMPPAYPDILPVISLIRSRGFSDSQLGNLALQLKCEAANRLGAPMIYDLVDSVKEYLTNTNFPTADCPFCLCRIEDGDEFFKTECFHYYHKYCLRRYLRYLQLKRSGGDDELDEIGLNTCIVCRKKFDRAQCLREGEGIVEPGNLRAVLEEYVESNERSREQEWRNQIFEKQKGKKGLIQPEPVDKMVITLSHTPEVERSLRAQSDSSQICS